MKWVGKSFLLLIALFFVVTGILMILHGEAKGWFVVIFFGICLVVFLLEIKNELSVPKVVAHKRGYDTKGLKEIRDRIDVPESHIDVWKMLFADTNASWVVFKNGTVVICNDSDFPEREAKEVLAQYKETIPGTDLGDFGIRLLEEAALWLINYPNGNVYNYMALEECLSDTAAGLVAMQIREEDANELIIIHIEKASHPM